MKGYIYVRNHPSYDGENACILGKLKIYMIQMHRYAIGEIIRGWFYNKVFIEKIILKI